MLVIGKKSTEGERGRGRVYNTIHVYACLCLCNWGGVDDLYRLVEVCRYGSPALVGDGYGVVIHSCTIIYNNNNNIIMTPV